MRKKGHKRTKTGQKQGQKNKYKIKTLYIAKFKERDKIIIVPIQKRDKKFRGHAAQKLPRDKMSGTN